MSEPLKPAIDFDGPLQAKIPPARRRAPRLRHPGGRQLRASAAGDRRRGRERRKRWWSRSRPKTRSLYGGNGQRRTAIFGVNIMAQGVKMDG